MFRGILGGVASEQNAENRGNNDYEINDKYLNQIVFAVLVTYTALG